MSNDQQKKVNVLQNHEKKKLRTETEYKRYCRKPAILSKEIQRTKIMITVLNCFIILRV